MAGLTSTYGRGVELVQVSQRVYSYDVELKPDGTVLFLRVDDALEELWGYSLEDLQHGAVASLITSQEARVADIVELCRQGRSSTTRMRMTSKDGTARVYMVHREPEVLDDRVVVRCAARDITESAIQDAQIQEREARLRLLAEHIPLTMWSTDREMNVTWWSGDGPAEVDLSHEITIAEFFGERSLVSAMSDASQQALLGQTITFDHMWHGSSFRFSLESHLDEVGDISGTIGVAINLTDVTRERSIPVASDQAYAVRTSVHPLQEAQHPGAIAVGDLWIDPDAYIVQRGGNEIALTITEFKLLLEFARNPGRVLSQKVLAEHVWGSDFVASHSNIPMAIKRLRAKIEDDPSQPEIIETVRGIGYRMRKPGA